MKFLNSALSDTARLRRFSYHSGTSSPNTNSAVSMPGTKPRRGRQVRPESEVTDSSVDEYNETIARKHIPEPPPRAVAKERNSETNSRPRAFRAVQSFSGPITEPRPRSAAQRAQPPPQFPEQFTEPGPRPPSEPIPDPFPAPNPYSEPFPPSLPGSIPQSPEPLPASRPGSGSDFRSVSLPPTSAGSSGKLFQKSPVKEKEEICFTDGKRRIDFVLAYDDSGLKIPDRKRKHFEEQLIKEGLELEHDQPDEDAEERLAFLKIHAPFKMLCEVAEVQQMRAPVFLDDDEDNMHSNQRGGTFASLTSWFNLSEKDANLLPKHLPYINAPFDSTRRSQFLIGNNPDKFFTNTQRIKVVWDILQRVSLTEKSPTTGKPKRGIEWLLEDEVYLAAYPLHDGPDENTSDIVPEKMTERQALIYNWATFKRIFKFQPLDAIKTYFGEHTAFYFAWLGFYTQMLIVPSIIGLCCFIYSIAVAADDITVKEVCNEDEYPGNIILCPTCVPPNCDFEELSHNCKSTWWGVVFDNPTTIVLCVMLVLWVVVFQELWKRKEAELASRWDAFDKTSIEDDIRPHYEARTHDMHINPITKKEEAYVPPKKRFLWVLASASALMFLIIIVTLALVALIALKIVLCGVLKGFGSFWDENKLEIAKMICDFLTFVVVELLALVYEHGAHKLTEYECPRTHEDYLSSFIWKLFIFEMMNNFMPVFYVAFIKGKILQLPNEENYLRELCDPGGCINELVATISILLLFRLVVSNAGEIGIPAVKHILEKRAEKEEGKKEESRWRLDYSLEEQELDGIYSEYMEMLVQYGYVAFFTPVFPLLPLIAFLNNLVEIRVDAINHTLHDRRPLPIKVSGIGIWSHCLDIINKTAVICNIAIIAFTSDFIPTLVYTNSYSPTGDQTGYTAFKLSMFSIKDWPAHEETLMEEANHTECFYQGYNEPALPYDHTEVWQEIMLLKVTFFAIFTICVYGFQWLCTLFIPDLPEDVRVHELRVQYLVKKALYDGGQKVSEPEQDNSDPSPNTAEWRRDSSKAATPKAILIDDLA